MNESETSMIKLARRHWRYLAPTWFMPAGFMLFIVIGEMTGRQVASRSWFIFIVAALLFVSTLAAGRLRHRVQIPWPAFYVIWLAPMMVVWCSLVFVRAAILTILGRPL